MHGHSETEPLPAATQKQTLADFTFDGVITALWRKKLDTNQIAKALRMPEAKVANRLAQLRDAGALG